jgi:hypothetical protein
VHWSGTERAFKLKGRRQSQEEKPMRRIRVRAVDVECTAILQENATADAVWEALPLVGRANRWGDEIYFEIPVNQDQATDARDVLDAGELGYWPVGHAFCIFWGPTPASRGSEIRAYSPVNVFGRLEGDPAALKDLSNGVEIRVESAGDPGGPGTGMGR